MNRPARVLVLLIIVCIVERCRAPERRPTARVVPRIDATVVTVRTQISPKRKAFLHKLVIANGKARFGDEVDQWRLFDLENQRVTFVDEVERTYRTVPLTRLVELKRNQFSREAPDRIGLARIVPIGEAKAYAEVSAKGFRIELGGYRREIWLASHPSIPEALARLALASDPITDDYASVVKGVFDTVQRLPGFPFADRSEMPYGGETLVVDRRVVKIERARIPASWLALAPELRDLDAPTKPAGDRRSALLLRLRRNARALGSQSSSKDRKAP